MKLPSFQRVTLRYPWLIAFLLLAIAVGVNFYFQPNFFQLNVLSGNLRTMLPLMLLAAAQTIVIMGAGIDLSVGAMVSLVNTILVTQISPEAGVNGIAAGVALGLGAGMLAGAINGLGVAFLRLQPIVTTYATSFIFGGIALYIMPRPGGNIPRSMIDAYRTSPLNLPVTLWVALIVIVGWFVLNKTRYGRYLFASGGEAEAAYATGVPVRLVRFSSYIIAGLLAGLSAVAITMSTGTGDPRIGDGMTLDSIVAVVLGGTRLSGGQGGIAGSVIGVAILALIRNIISFARVPTWWQTLVDALIIIAALAGPGIVREIRRRRAA